jgi:magnesium transporter
VERFEFKVFKRKIVELLKHKKAPKDEFHPSKIATFLKKLKKEDEEEFFKHLKELPNEILGEVLLELPEPLKDEAIKKLPIEKLKEAIEELESDDATDLLKDIEEIDKNLEKQIYYNLSEDDREEIDQLSIYDERQAGAYMQLEVFEAYLEETISQAIERFRKRREEEEIENIQQVYVIDEDRHLKGIVPLSDLITFDFNKRFKEIIKEGKYAPISVRAKEPINDVIKKFEDLNLPVLAVIDDMGKLVGRITSDDIIDLIEEQATDQIYSLAGVEDEAEEEENIKIVTKKRAWWLFVNLWTAIIASVVIGLFDETIQKYVALAILMPIVASMGGNAGTQTLTVVVRKLALGEIEWHNAKEALVKESLIALFNGLIFAFIMGIIAWMWFNDTKLGFVISLAMVINLFAAGFFGATIPLFLKKIGADPAVGSSVLLTTVTDVVGFFAFLGLAKVILIK